jgi:hypothetical protein
MVKVLILGPTLLQRVTEPELDVEVEGPVAIKACDRRQCRAAGCAWRRSWCAANCS